MCWNTLWVAVKSEQCYSVDKLDFLAPGGSGADPGEAGAASGRPAEAGGDQRVLVRPGEHHQGQGAPALWKQQARAGGEELLGHRQPALPSGAAAPSAGAGAPPAHLQWAAAEVSGKCQGSPGWSWEEPFICEASCRCSEARHDQTVRVTTNNHPLHCPVLTVLHSSAYKCSFYRLKHFVYVAYVNCNLCTKWHSLLGKYILFEYRFV